MRKKVIISITPHLKGGGVEKAIMELNKGFLNFKDCEAHIITTKPYHSLMPIPKGIKVHRLNTELRNFLNIKVGNKKKAKIIKDYIRKEITRKEPDLVICHLDTISKIMKHSGFKNIFHVVHSNLSNNKLKNKSRIKQTLTKFKIWLLYKNLSIICVSRGIEEDLNESFNLHKTQVIYNGVSIENLISLSKDYSPPLPNNYFLHVGNFSEAKRQDRLVQAYINSNIQDVDLVLLGEHTDRTKVIYNLIQDKPSVAKQIHMPGYSSNPYPWMANSSGLILSSDYEGLGMVLIEAIALGIPVISTNCKSGPSEIFGGKYEHCLCDLSVSSLKDKILQLHESRANFIVPLQDEFKAETMCLKYYSLMIKND